MRRRTTSLAIAAATIGLFVFSAVGAHADPTIAITSAGLTAPDGSGPYLVNAPLVNDPIPQEVCVTDTNVCAYPHRQIPPLQQADTPITGTVSDAISVTVTISNDSAQDGGAATLNDDGTWTFYPEFLIPPGTYTVVATAQDEEGITSSTDPVTVTVI